MSDRPRASLAALIAEVEVIATDGDLGLVVDHMTYDSRLVRPGSLFVAYAGVNEDVHAYIPAAVAAGAAALLVERPPAALRREGIPPNVSVIHVRDSRLARAQVAAALHGHPTRHLAVVGVTGTDGKTTTSTLAAAMLQAADIPTGVVTTVEASLPGRSLDTGLHVTTPEPEDLQSYLAAMVAGGCRAAVLEVTSHALAQRRAAAVDYDVAVLTNITQEALEFHGTFHDYVEAKARLFAGLSTSARKPGVEKAAVINRDDPAWERMAAEPVEQIVLYGQNASADFKIVEVTSSAAGIQVAATTPEGPVRLMSPLVGEYNAYNLLAAAAAASRLGAGQEAWTAGARAVRGIPGRMERVSAGQDFTALVDFAHTPNALAVALDAARGLAGPSGRVLTVFGCAGLRDPGKRPAMGRIAAAKADFTVLTAEDPRTEDPSAILEAIAQAMQAAGALEGRDYVREVDRGAAIRRAVAAARTGDVVIVCGKGHEQSMAFGTDELPWDDRLALKAALEERD